MEVLEKLCHYHALSSNNEKSLFQSMHFKSQCSMHGGREHTKAALSAKDATQHPKTRHACRVKSLQPLCSNLDVLCNVANQYFQKMNIDACYKPTMDILDKDPYHSSATLLHVACCVQKGKFEELFSLGHRLVDHSSSKQPISLVHCGVLLHHREQTSECEKVPHKSCQLGCQFCSSSHGIRSLIHQRGGA